LISDRVDDSRPLARSKVAKMQFHERAFMERLTVC
jgi:hypothetical protein